MCDRRETLERAVDYGWVDTAGVEEVAAVDEDIGAGFAGVREDAFEIGIEVVAAPAALDTRVHRRIEAKVGVAEDHDARRSHRRPSLRCWRACAERLVTRVNRRLVVLCCVKTRDKRAANGEHAGMGRARQTQHRLTERQRQVLRLIAKGHTNAEIAERLGITLAGAKWHVSELLTRFGVETRDELAERWSAESRPAARVGRLWAGAGSLSLKHTLAVVSGAGLVVVAGAVTVAGLSHSNDDDESGAVAAATTAQATATASPTPSSMLPTAPGAIWTPDQAYRRAEVFARWVLDTDRNRTVTYADLPLRRARWLPGTTRFEPDPIGLGEDDFYWVPQDGKAAADLWVFEFETTGQVVNGNNEVYDGANIMVQIVLEDGVVDDDVTAERHLYRQQNGDPIGGGAGNYQSRRTAALMEQNRLQATPAGDAVTFGWHNGLEGGAPLEAYFSAAGSWCVRGANLDHSPGGDMVCAEQANAQLQTVQFSHGGRAPRGGVLEDVFIFANTAPTVVALGLLVDGQETRYLTYAPPAEAGFTRRFAWLGIERVGPQGFELVAYDAAGTELWREVRAPDSSLPPPPPPTPTFGP